ncbi:MAG: hypothetical protein NTW78_06185 [Campylobacterales bacterium]|nr:hypothetical protein [Campylobacterales bacterium]
MTKRSNQNTVINGIKEYWNFSLCLSESLDVYSNDEWNTQFISKQFNEYEVVVVKNVNGIKDGFYVVKSKPYVVFINSNSIRRKIEKISLNETKRNLKTSQFISLYNNTINTTINSKKVDKYFIQYIKQNTLIYFNYKNYIKEFL